MKTKITVAAVFIVATTILSGCASPYNQMQGSQPYPTSNQSSQSQYSMYGVSTPYSFFKWYKAVLPVTG